MADQAYSQNSQAFSPVAMQAFSSSASNNSQKMNQVLMENMLRGRLRTGAEQSGFQPPNQDTQ